MRRKLILPFLSFLAWMLILNSCQKELSCENCANLAPIARAGADQLITLPADTVTLDGNASSDPDGTISAFIWTKISGPATFTFSNRDSSVTGIKNLLPGIYSFELKVTDNGGLGARDTLTVTVNAAGTTNQPPIARAGTDQSITLPTNVVTIDAGTSADPDGSIVIYSWKQILGPNRSVINDSSRVSSPVNNLIQGVYQFEITVYDNGGLFAKDTVRISVNPMINSCAPNRPIVTARLMPVGTLSQARQDIYTATAGNKILFAGGLGPTYRDVSTRVDIYDFITNTWATAELSQVRHAMTVGTVGNKILLAGGSNYESGGLRGLTRVDIYDAVANTWSTAELSEARGFLATATLGDEIFFAGGYQWNNGPVFSDRVDIYNSTTNSWSTASLSEPREGLTATAAGGKVYFAGGNNGDLNITSKQIDIYDGATNSWTTSALMQGKQYHSSIAFAGKIYWAGGSGWGITQIPTDQVEIRDINTQASTITCLSQEKASFGTVIKENEILFFIGGYDLNPKNFDIYNAATNSWSIGTLSQGFRYPAIISVNNKVYVAGGELYPGGGLSNQVSLLEW